MDCEVKDNCRHRYNEAQLAILDTACGNIHYIYSKKLLKSVGLHRCTKCGEILPRTNEYFSKNPANNDGLRPECKSCGKLKWTKEKLDRIKDPDWYRAKHLTYNARLRAKEQNVLCDRDIINTETLYILMKNATHCECCGKEFDKEINDPKLDNTITLDKIIPKNGYVKGNIAWICMRCNRIKVNATPTEIQTVADWVKIKWGEINEGV